MANLEADFDSAGDLDGSGGFGGFQAGYNFTWGNLVWGLETDISLGDANPDGTCPYDATLTCDINMGPMATLRPRIGYATGNWLLFATGGITAARFSVESSGVSGSVDDVEYGAFGWT
ncbi:MAG: outer membrane protein, partial [Pirellulaceae bacterium]